MSRVSPAVSIVTGVMTRSKHFVVTSALVPTVRYDT